MIDQESGRVQRLKDRTGLDCLSITNWKALAAASVQGPRGSKRLGQVIGSQLAEVRITHVAAPVLDLLIDGADPIIGDRSFGTTPAEVIPLATAFIDGLQRCGITAVVKLYTVWVALIKIAMTHFQ